jgi:PLP dependent protein
MIAKNDLSKLLKTLGDVTLLAISKQQSVQKIRETIQVGLYRFGENYVQEAIPKIEILKKEGYTNIEWHFIGQIQSNKTGEIAKYFDWVHSLDRKKIAARLNAQRSSGSILPLNICIEINNSGDVHKPGIKLSELADFIAYLEALPNLKWRGLMTTVTEDYEKVAKAFYDLKKQGYNIDTLSMGCRRTIKKPSV